MGAPLAAAAMVRLTRLRDQLQIWNKYEVGVCTTSCFDLVVRQTISGRRRSRQRGTFDMMLCASSTSSREPRREAVAAVACLRLCTRRVRCGLSVRARLEVDWQASRSLFERKRRCRRCDAGQLTLRAFLIDLQAAGQVACVRVRLRRRRRPIW